jgi:hypothetical protein
MPAEGMCVVCGKPLCIDCIVELGGKYYCKEHAKDAFVTRQNHQPYSFGPSPMYGPEGAPPTSAYYYGYREMPYPTKSKFAALLLCLFGGLFGLHRFYVGKVGTGLIWFFTMGFFFFGWFVDLLLIISGTFKDSHGLPLD